MENTTESNVNLDHLTFSIIDYVLFVGMLIVSTAIGLYFGVYKKQNTLAEYLLGGQNMKFFPVAISLAARLEFSIFLFKNLQKIIEIKFQLYISDHSFGNAGRNLRLRNAIYDFLFYGIWSSFCYSECLLTR